MPFTSCADASSFYKLMSREKKNVWYGAEVSLNTAIWLLKDEVGLTHWGAFHWFVSFASRLAKIEEWEIIWSRKDEIKDGVL